LAQAARAYTSYSQPEIDYGKRQHVQVRPGGRQQNKEEAQLASRISLVKCAMVFTCVLAVFAIIHVSLDNAAVTLSLQAQTTTSEISDARHEVNELEVQVSSLSNPTRIKTEAAELGMHAASDPTVIYLSEDIVVTDDSGNLSLAGSTRVLAGNTITG
jgi:cell division protein FtsL